MQTKRKFLLLVLGCLIVTIMMALSACNLNGNEPQPSNTETDNPTSQEHSHSFLNEWSYDGTYHWHACSGCEEVRDKGEHDWNSGVIITAPTETSEGVKEYTCNTCGKTKVDSIPMLNHEHTFELKWTSDDTYHWHAATCGHETEKSGKAEHTWDNGIITKEASETEAGVRTYTCVVCSATKTEEIPVLTHVHTYEEGWTSDDTYHWHASTCGHETEISGKAEHTWDSGVVTKEASETEAGARIYTCVVCSATKTEEIPMLTHVHTYEEGWTSDDTYHWHASTCGHETEISGKAEHTWNNGVVTKDPTETTAGEKTYTCQVCGKTKIEEIAQLSHTHTFEKGWTSDNAYHWHASTCGHETEVSEKAEHTWDNGVITKEASETETGIITYTCTVCDRTKTETIAVLPHTHTYETKWTYDEDYHWHASACGHETEISGKAEHVWDNGVVTKEASETETGIKTYACTVCGKTKFEVIPKIVHTNTYTVTFYDYDGITVLAEKNVNEGMSAELPTEPTKTGATFLGWSGNYNNVIKNENVIAVYSDNANVFMVIGEEGNVDDIITVTLSLKGNVSLCRYFLTLHYDNTVLELVDYDAELSLYAPTTNPEKDDEGNIIGNANGVINVTWAASSNKTKKADIIELQFRIVKAADNGAKIDIEVHAVQKISGTEQVDADYSCISSTVTVTE